MLLRIVVILAGLLAAVWILDRTRELGFAEGMEAMYALEEMKDEERRQDAYEACR